MLGIICDSATDMPAELSMKNFIEVIPLRVILGEKSYRDNIEINEATLLNFMKEDFAKTSLPSYEEVEKGFLKLIENGYDEILSINISSGLSGTYNLFKLVARDVSIKHPEVRIECFDTLSISIGSGLYVYKAVQLLESKKNLDYILSELARYRNGKITGFFIIPTLKFLKAGGRIGRVSATIGDVLNLKPVISVDPSGVYYSVAKARGMKHALERLIDKLVKFTEGKTIEALTVCRTGELDSTFKSLDKLLEKFKDVKIGRSFNQRISSSMTVHAGEGLVGVAVMIN